MKIQIIAMVFLAFARSAISEDRDVSLPQTRADTIAAAQDLLKARVNPATRLPVNFIDPFTKAGMAPENPISQVALPGNDHEVLAAWAAKVKPSGVAHRDGVSILLLPEKKLKVGDAFTITVNGASYPVELVAIDRATFTVRLNHEVLTRPIK